MIYVFTHAPDPEEIIVENLKKFMIQDARSAELWGGNYKNIRISSIHPFAELISENVNEIPVKGVLFPSITIVEDDSGKEVNAGVEESNIKIYKEDITEVVDNKKKYLISQETINALNILLPNANSYVFAKEYTTIITARISVEIWSDNPIHKNNIFQLMQIYFLGIGMKILNSDWSLKIDQSSFSGSKSGNYNYDFGKTLYGASITFSIDYPLTQWVIDDETEEILSVEHYKENINGESV